LKTVVPDGIRGGNPPPFNAFIKLMPKLRHAACCTSKVLAA
jgi:hypothetical protein